jgi:hypothetical protein
VDVARAESAEDDSPNSERYADEAASTPTPGTQEYDGPAED